MHFSYFAVKKTAERRKKAVTATTSESTAEDEIKSARSTNRVITSFFL